MKMNCEIIQDLLPSYVDEVCSKSTKECVEAHIAECKECRELVHIYKENDFSAESLDKKQIDGWKKIKNKVKKQSIFSYALLVVLIVFGFYTFEISYNPIPTIAYYVLFAVLMTATCILTMNQKNEGKLSKKDKILLVISGISIIYASFMYFYFIFTIIDGKMPFNMKPANVGPFLHDQAAIALLIQIGTFCYMFYRCMKKNIACNWGLGINLTGIFLMLTYTTVLRRLSDAAGSVKLFVEITIVVLVIGVIGTVVQYMQMRKNKIF